MNCLTRLSRMNRLSRSCAINPMKRRARSYSMFSPTPEHNELRKSLSDFCKDHVEPQAIEYNRDEKFNLPLFRKLGEMGFLGVTVDPEYGGSGMDATAATIIHQEIASCDPAFCLSYLAHSMLFVNNLHINGSHEQKLKYLPDACSGAKIGGMCMSEPGAGTDVLAMSTNARKDGEDYILNGNKMWITNGTLDGTDTGDFFLVYARTGEKKTDLSMFLVEKGMEGFELGQKIENKCGMRASMTAELVFENLRVPSENLVGSHNGAVICMMRNLEIERVALAAMSLGIARRCLKEMHEYSNERSVFGSKLNEFGQIQQQISQSYAEYMAAACYIYNTSNNLDLNSSGNVLDSDGVKLFVGAVAKQIADRSIQVLGGNGYVGEYRVEQLWRDSKLLEIGGGTNEAHHKNMISWMNKGSFLDHN